MPQKYKIWLIVSVLKQDPNMKKVKKIIKKITLFIMTKRKLWGMRGREWPAGKTESEIKLLIQGNSKPKTS